MVRSFFSVVGSRQRRWSYPEFMMLTRMAIAQLTDVNSCCLKYGQQATLQICLEEVDAGEFSIS